MENSVHSNLCPSLMNTTAQYFSNLCINHLALAWITSLSYTINNPYHHLSFGHSQTKINVRLLVRYCKNCENIFFHAGSMQIKLKRERGAGSGKPVHKPGLGTQYAWRAMTLCRHTAHRAISTDNVSDFNEHLISSRFWPFKPLKQFFSLACERIK